MNLEKFLQQEGVLTEDSATPISKGAALAEIRRMVTNLQNERDKKKQWTREYANLNSKLRMLYTIIAIVDSIGSLEMSESAVIKEEKTMSTSMLTLKIPFSATVETVDGQVKAVLSYDIDGQLIESSVLSKLSSMFAGRPESEELYPANGETVAEIPVNLPLEWKSTKK